MKTVVASIDVPGAPIEAEQLWHDRSRWASWIDGFGHLAKLEGEWPAEGARRVWASRPGGRGLVSEIVTGVAAGRGVTLRVEDERVWGYERVRFEGGPETTRITVELELEAKERLPPARRWWLRRQRGEALQRTLRRFSYELAADR